MICILWMKRRGENVLDGFSELALLEIQASSLIALLQCIYFDVQKARY